MTRPWLTRAALGMCSKAYGIRAKSSKCKSRVTRHGSSPWESSSLGGASSHAGSCPENRSRRLGFQGNLFSLFGPSWITINYHPPGQMNRLEQIQNFLVEAWKLCYWRRYLVSHHYCWATTWWFLWVISFGLSSHSSSAPLARFCWTFLLWAKLE